MDFNSWDAGLHTVDNDYFQHYGVLGMKWGQRRYQNEDGSLTKAGLVRYSKEQALGLRRSGENGYQYHSHATKKYSKKALKLEKKASKTKNSEKAEELLAKSKKFKNRAKRSAEVDKGEQEYAKSMSTGKAVALTLLGGGNSSKGYAQYRAMAGQKGKNMSGEKIVAALKAYRKGSYGSRLAKAAYIRKDENKRTLGAKAYKVNQGVSGLASNLINKAANSAGGWTDRDARAREKAKRKNRG